MNNKKGQFYIIAAIIIVIIISGIAGISTFIVVNPEPKTMEDINLNLREETSRIIDYGIYNGTDLTSLEENFTEKDFASYILDRTNNANMTFIYGNKSGLKMIEYSTTDAGNSCLGSSCVDSLAANIKRSNIQVDADDKTTEVTLLNKKFLFKLRKNEMFYFVIIKEKEGEIYVKTNQ
ncbi:MAG: hypothetical protein AABX54_00100 [Nanoarchaeota archaeon]